MVTLPSHVMDFQTRLIYRTCSYYYCLWVSKWQRVSKCKFFKRLLQQISWSLLVNMSYISLTSAKDLFTFYIFFVHLPYHFELFSMACDLWPLHQNFTSAEASVTCDSGQILVNLNFGWACSSLSSQWILCHSQPRMMWPWQHTNFGAIKEACDPRHAEQFEMVQYLLLSKSHYLY